MSDQRTVAQQCFGAGNKALEMQNWDYAIQMYRQACKLDPGNSVFRQNLRGCERKKYNENGSGKRLAGMKITKIKTLIKKNKMQQEWAKVDELAEDGLELNPWDAALSAELGVSARERGFDELAVFCFDTAKNNDQNNIDYWVQLAYALKEVRRYPDAIKCWETVRRLDPNNGEARQQITHLTTQGTIEGGYDTAEDTKGMQAQSDERLSAYDKDFLARGASKPQVDGPGQSMEADLLRRIRKNPQEDGAYIHLSKLYLDDKKFDQAIQVYQQLLEACGEDPNVGELKEDAEIDLLEQKLDQARDALGLDPENAQKKQNRIEAEKALLKRRLEVLDTRVERYPNDLRRKYEYAQCLLQNKQPEEAIPLLQQAKNDSRLKGNILLELGKCFVQIKNLSLALRNFEMAIPELDPQDDREKLCEAHYSAGRVYQHNKQKEKAEEHYNEVLMLDYGYRDVNKRLTALQSEEAE